MSTRFNLLIRIAGIGKHHRHFPCANLQPHRHITFTAIKNDVSKIKMPALSPTMQEGTIIKWLKKEGDAIAAGDILCEIQTDKAVVGFEYEEDGVLAKILKPDNSANVSIGTLIALIVEEGEDWKNVDVSQYQTADSPKAAPVTESSQAKQTKPHEQRPIGPAVRSLLQQYGLDASIISASGPHGRLLKGDVLQYIQSKQLKVAEISKSSPPPVPTASPPKSPLTTVAPTPPSRPQLTTMPDSGHTDIPNSNIRSVIARRLTESKTTIPHSYATISSQMDKILALRKELTADGMKVSVNDFIVKAAAVALQRLPEVNAIWSGESARMLSNIDISVAVATDNGLITPIVKDAIGKGVMEISENIKELAGRAKQGRLKPEEFQGGSFTISNLGMFGISEFSAVINPPQACILAVGTSQRLLDAEGKPGTHMVVTLSSDARVVDDLMAVQFLNAFKEALENPSLLLSQSPVDVKQKLFAK